jgi:hypothetical protein
MQGRLRSWFLLSLLAACALSGCRREESAQARLAGGASKPAQAVRLLTRHLRDNDLDAFARDAVPPALHAQLEAAWKDGRTRWPLDELPFDERLPTLLGALAAPGSETRLQKTFDRQFSRADAELKAAAASMGLFGVQYVRNEGDFSAAERDHYAQFVAAISRWGMSAPLGDPQRARAAIPRLAAAARRTGLASDADFARLGMRDSLRRLSDFLSTTKQVLAGYGLRLDRSLEDLDAGLQTQTGDTAKVRMRYTLGGDAIDTVVEVERHGGRWYLSDYLRHAEAAVAKPVAPAAAGPATANPSEPR